MVRVAGTNEGFMKKILIALLSTCCVSAWASEINLQSGDSVTINILGCYEGEEPSIMTNKRTRTVTATCAAVNCQVEHGSGDVYNVYSFHETQCTWQGCDNNAKRVGSFTTSDDYLFFTPISYIKNGMSRFMSTSQKCGSLRLFVSGSYNGGKGFYEIKR